MNTSTFDSLLINKPLRIVFWLYGVVFSQVLWAACLWLYFNAASLGTDLLIFSVLMGYTAWICIQIWHCGPNVEKPVYGEIARFLTAAWAINSVFVVGFLLLQRMN